MQRRFLCVRIYRQMRHADKIIIILILVASGYQAALAQNNLWTLKQCIDSAIVNNLTLQQSVNTIELDRINVKQSRNNLLPAVNGSAGKNLSIARMVTQVPVLYKTGTVWPT